MTSEVLLLQNNVPKYVNITGDVNLVRDTHSMGVLNVNQNALEAYQKKRQIALERLAEQRRKDRELNTLRTEVAELRQLVMKLVEKQDANS